MILVRDKRAVPQIGHLFSLDARLFEHFDPLGEGYSHSVVTRRELKVSCPREHLLYHLRKALVLLLRLK